MKDGIPSTIYLKDYQPSAWLIDAVELHFDLQESHCDVYSTIAFSQNSDNPSSELVLDGEQLELLEVSIDGKVLGDSAYQVSEEHLTINQVPESFELKAKVRIFPAKNTSLEGLYLSSGNFCTQCEAQGFRKITYFLDRPDVMTVYRVSIEADQGKYPVLLSNGNPLDQQSLDNGRHRADWEDPHPKPSYLFALVAGDLACNSAQFTTASGKQVTLNVYTEPHNLEFTEYALASLARAMQWDEERYGLEYDLDLYNIVAVDDFNMGAMENKGLNVFNTKYVLASPETATDDDFVAVEAVIAHEYFHNWTGNRVTCRDWFQLSLKEGLTVFRDQEFTADMHSAAVKRIDDVRMLRSAQFPEDASPMAHPIRPASFVEINNFYTLTVYEKGAEIVRLYQTLLGRDGFRRGMDLYFERHDGQAVTTEDFLAAMADANQMDLSRLQAWYDQAGTPEVRVVGMWDIDRQQYKLKVSQKTPDTSQQTNKKAVVIPLNIGLLAPDGSELNAMQSGTNEKYPADCLLEDEQIFVYEGVDQSPTPSLLRGFSAPVNIKFEYSDEQLALLMAHDSDAFNRWDASQRLASRLLAKRIDGIRGGRTVMPDVLLSEALKQVLASDFDNALKAEMLKLPGEAELSEKMDVIDVDSVHMAREYTRSELGKNLNDHFQEIYDTMLTPGQYVPDAVCMAKRRLRNVALAYLLAGNREEARDTAVKQFNNANNMTDTIGAMWPLSQIKCSQRDEVFEGFETKWGNNTLVMDKWFSMQAMAPLSDTLERVNALMGHPLFSLKNPNKVRALIGAFMGNPTLLHKVDGSGYEFVIERIIELDSLNPQIAARLVKPFSKWRQYDEERQAHMRSQLDRLLQQSKLSKDVTEIVQRSLE